MGEKGNIVKPVFVHTNLELNDYLFPGFTNEGRFQFMPEVSLSLLDWLPLPDAEDLVL